MAKVKCIMDQFIEGLKAGGVLDGIVQQTNLWEALFVLSRSSTLSRDIYFCAHARVIFVCVQISEHCFGVISE